MRVLLLGFFMICSIHLFARAPELTVKELSKPPSNVIRTCCAFGAELSIARIPFIKKTDIIAVDQIGWHHFLGSKDEGNGIIYTRRGGFIDLGHLRDYADWTAYLFNLLQSNLENSEAVVLNLESEGGAKTLIFKNIQRLDTNLIAELAGSIAYDLSVWHEIATWFGISFIPMIPERYSSFSPEDLYSNLLGIKLGIQAINSDLPFDDAMTMLLANMLDSLGAMQNFEGTYMAMEEVEDIWWTRKRALPSGKVLLIRYLDSESFLLPWLLPDDKKNQSAYRLVKPDPVFSQFYEFSINLNRKISILSMHSTVINKTISQLDFSWLIHRIAEDQKNIEIKSAIKLQKLNMKKDRKQHAIIPWNQAKLGHFGTMTYRL